MRRLLLVLALVAVGTVFARGQVPCDVVALQPACEVAMLPGPMANTLEIVRIDGQQTFASSGQLQLTTVAVDSSLDIREWLQARIDRRIDIRPREAIFPRGKTPEEVSQENAVLMAQSQVAARVAGLVAAGYDADDLFAGARIVDVVDDAAPGAEQFEADDVIVAVNGQPVTRANDLIGVMGQRTPGDEVVLTTEDGRDIAVTTIENPNPEHAGRAFIGILLSDELSLPFEVDIDAGNIGGPSAGLMFALGIVDLLDPDDLTGGLVIAGTGTITVDGAVGAIGGIRQKISAASTADEDRDAAVAFLVPRANLPEARTAAVSGSILLVPVDTIADALAALQDLRRGVDPPGAVALGS